MTRNDINRIQYWAHMLDEAFCKDIENDSCKHMPDHAFKILNIMEEKDMRKYSKRQILESIKYWKRQLDAMNESADDLDLDSGSIVDEVLNILLDDRELLQLAKDYRGDLEQAAEDAIDSGLAFGDAVDAVYDALVDIAESIGKPVENGEPAEDEFKRK